MENKNLPPEFTDEELKMPEGTLPVVDESKHGKLALMLGGLIVVLALILVGLYIWYESAFNMPSNSEINEIERAVEPMPNEPEMENSDATVQQLETVSSSNSLDAIEADIESTSFDQLDSELQAIEAELEAAVSAQ